MSLELVMFDLDGTLIDTVPEIAAVVGVVLRERGLAEPASEQVRGWIGLGSTELMRRALAWAGAPEGPDVATRRFQHLLEQRNGGVSALFPGVREALTTLSRAGVRLAVVSNKEQHLVELLLAVHGLRDFFGCVIGGDTLAAKKPDPLPLLHCLRRFGVAAENALFVGDSLIDLACAKAAGVTAWSVGYGYERAEVVRLARPARIIDDLQAIAA